MIRWVAIALLAGCTGAPPPTPAEQNRNFGAEKPTQVGRYLVTLAFEPDPPVLGELFEVDARVALPDGLPLETGKVTLDARMPQHEHGMETRPIVDEGACTEVPPDSDADSDAPANRKCRHPDGRYRAKGFKFHMSGKWTVLVNVDGPGGPDSTTFIYRMP